jgi:secreted trypsin-like serine protease
MLIFVSMRALQLYIKALPLSFRTSVTIMMELLALLLFVFTSEAFALTNSKIVNGELAVEGQFPHMVQLSIRRREATKYCGGSLIDSQWVLTVRNLNFCGYLSDL